MAAVLSIISRRDLTIAAHHIETKLAILWLPIVVRDSIVTGSGKGLTCSGKIPSPTRARVHHS